MGRLKNNHFFFTRSLIIGTQFYLIVQMKIMLADNNDNYKFKIDPLAMCFFFFFFFFCKNAS